MAKKKNFFVRDYNKHIGATVLLVACMLSFMFMVIGTPLGVLKPKEATNVCYTLWGTRKCDSPNYDWRVNFDNCTVRRVRFHFAEAFSIIAMFFNVLTGIACWYCISGSNAKWWTVLVAVISIASSLVTWSVVSALYYSSFCGSDTYTHKHTKYGPGFALIVTAFALDCCGLVCFLVLG
ncbi:amastin [Trypanosoma conorhini]|uniref:Amastin n=1 Tax=Trypanosoma conorhini TaxID=83891 RepID=A0A3R7MNJ6_9TRYP|nr:amastin [Trypanosoma conorhini]RNF18152.1 amastin [Trypanosoma conorhini]